MMCLHLNTCFYFVSLSPGHVYQAITVYIIKVKPVIYINIKFKLNYLMLTILLSFQRMKYVRLEKLTFNLKKEKNNCQNNQSNDNYSFLYYSKYIIIANIIYYINIIKYLIIKLIFIFGHYDRYLKITAADTSKLNLTPIYL